MRRLFVRLLASVLIAIVLFWLAVRGMHAEIEAVADERGPWALVWESARAVPLTALGLYALLFLAVHVLKLYRWALQVRPLGERDTWKVLRIGAIGNAAIVALPLRLGEVVRPALLARESPIPFSTAMGTAVVERVIDGLVIVALLAGTLLLVAEPTPLLWNAALACAALFVGAAVTIAVFVVRRDLAVRAIRATLGRIRVSLADRVEALLGGFTAGLSSLWSGGVLWPYLALTVGYWGLNVVSLVVLARAFGFELGWWEGAGVMGILVAGILLPSGPGFFGNFQLFLAEGMRLVLPGVVLGAAGLAFALVMNVVQVALQLVVALPALPATGLRGTGLALDLAVNERESGNSAGASRVSRAPLLRERGRGPGAVHGRSPAP